MLRSSQVVYFIGGTGENGRVFSYVGFIIIIKPLFVRGVRSLLQESDLSLGLRCFFSPVNSSGTVSFDDGGCLVGPGSGPQQEGSKPMTLGRFSQVKFLSTKPKTRNLVVDSSSP